MIKPNLLPALIWLTTAAFLFNGCNKNNDESPSLPGEVSFQVSPPQGDDNGRTAQTQSFESVLLSIEDDAGNVIHQDLSLALTDFGDGYISEPLSLPPGNYRLIAFGVVDDTQAVVMATPAQDSPLAHLVTDPVPIDFTIATDEVTQVVPEVVSTEGFTPEDFGYLSFRFTQVSLLYFQLTVMTYDATLQNYALTTAELEVSAGGTVLHTRTLGDTTNVIAVRDGFDHYQLIITKAGFATADTTFTRMELQAFANDPLIVVLRSGNSSNPQGIFTDSGQNLGSSNSTNISLGDVDGDGDLDAWVANRFNQPNKVWLNDGAGQFTDSGQNLGSSRSQNISLGDVDGDGDLDAFVANGIDQPNKVWLND